MGHSICSIQAKVGWLAGRPSGGQWCELVRWIYWSTARLAARSASALAARSGHVRLWASLAGLAHAQVSAHLAQQRGPTCTRVQSREACESARLQNEVPMIVAVGRSILSLLSVRDRGCEQLRARTRQVDPPTSCQVEAPSLARLSVC